MNRYSDEQLVQELERRQEEREQKRKELEEKALKLKREFEELSNKHLVVLSKDTGDLVGFARTYEGTIDLVLEYLKRYIQTVDFDEELFEKSKELAKEDNHYHYTHKNLVINNRELFLNEYCDTYETEDNTMYLDHKFVLGFSEKFKEILDGKDWVLE